MSEPDWHGWHIQDGLSLHVGVLPGRSWPSLYFDDRDTAKITVLASFRGYDTAEDLMRLLDHWTIDRKAGSRYQVRAPEPAA